MLLLLELEHLAQHTPSKKKMNRIGCKTCEILLSPPSEEGGGEGDLAEEKKNPFPVVLTRFGMRFVTATTTKVIFFFTSRFSFQ